MSARAVDERAECPYFRSPAPVRATRQEQEAAARAVEEMQSIALALQLRDRAPRVQRSLLADWRRKERTV